MTELFAAYVLPLLTPVLLAALLLAITVIDLRHRIIPDSLNAALAWLGVLHLSLSVPLNLWWAYAACAFILLALGAFLAGPYSQWRGQAMLGWGDVKFFAAAGLWLPFYDLWLFLLLAGIIGIGLTLLHKRLTGQAQAPFAPALAAALWLSSVCGAEINSALGALFGVS